MKVSISVDSKKLDKVLGKLEKDLRNFKDALKLAGEEIDEAIDEAFANKRSIEGKAWKKWSKATRKIHGTGGSLLQRSGRMKRSIRLVVKSNEVVIEVRSPQAAAQQFGNPGNKAFGRGRAPIPARSYLPIRSLKDLSPQMVKRIQEVLEKYFELD